MSSTRLGLLSRAQPPMAIAERYRVPRPGEVRALVHHAGLRVLTKNTITTLEALEREMVTVRAKGIAYDRQEVVPDVACVAAPVLDRYGTVVAAISASMPAYRFERNHARVIQPLKDAAVAISARIAAAQAKRAPLAMAEPELVAV